MYLSHAGLVYKRVCSFQDSINSQLLNYQLHNEVHTRTHETLLFFIMTQLMWTVLDIITNTLLFNIPLYLKLTHDKIFFHIYLCV